ncbi:uncharacterized protein METZ01_LOCUS293112, partial [marine metagenome]
MIPQNSHHRAATVIVFKNPVLSPMLHNQSCAPSAGNTAHRNSCIPAQWIKQSSADLADQRI